MGAPKRLKGFPRYEVLPREALRCRASELDLLASLGDPTGQTDPHSADPRFFWDLAWPCGLITAVALDQLSEVLTVHLDRLEVDHALRHLRIEPVEVWRSDLDGAAEGAPDPSPTDWVLWRQGDDGNRAVVAFGLAERDARCRLDELEEAGAAHRQVYGVSRSPAPGS